MTRTRPFRILCRLRIVAATAVILAATLATARVAAHPAADTEVVVTLSRDGAFELTFTTALDALLIKLEALAGKPRDAGLSDAAREGRVVLLQETLRNELELTIDGKPVVTDCLNRGLLINCTMDRILRFVPPLVITQRDIDRLIDVLADVLSKRA